MSKKEREIWEFQMDLRIFLFVMVTWFLPKGQVWKRVWILEVCTGLKTGVENYI